MTGNVQSGNLRRKGTQDRAPDEHKVALSNHLISRNSKEAKPHARMWGGGYRHPRSLQVSVWIHDVTLEQIHSVIQINHVILWARSFLSQHNLWQPSWRQPATYPALGRDTHRDSNGGGTREQGRGQHTFLWRARE